MSVQHKKFKTEVQQLLDLVIHSLYSNRDIFLRELVSNASDAIDRARFEALSDQAVLEDDHEWAVIISTDPKAKTLTIRDNGVGMSQEEVEKNIGTIASSGTRKFLAELKEKKQDGAPLPPELIGQFGVGFYSAFMVADKVELVTRRAGDRAAGTRWCSTGDGSYDVETVAKETRGTEITLHLKPEMDEYLEEWKIRKIVKKYSDFVEHPVRLEKPEAEKAEDKLELLNSQKAIWQRPKSEVTAEQYQEFYRHISHDFQEPAETIHWTAEGATEFKALLFLPKNTGFDMLMPEQSKHGVQLYVKRVFITDNCEELRPPYLRFLRGVVDSSDLPLNVSRELLQENRLIRTIRENLVKKVLNTLGEMRDKRRDAYNAFWKEFGAMLKEGMHTDAGSGEKIQDLLMFETAGGKPGALSTLAEYVKLMPDTQKEIYYAIGETRQALENAPHLEAFRKAGFDVLFLTDPIDEWLAQDLTKYQDKPLKCVSKGDIELPAPAAGQDEPPAPTDEEMKPLVARLQEILGDRVRNVQSSKRLTDSACCLVADEHAMGPHMERLMKAMNRDVPVKAKGTLEINPRHPVVGAMRSLLEKDPQHPKLAEYAEMLHDQALLTAGLPVADLLAFTKRVSGLMAAEGGSLLK